MRLSKPMIQIFTNVSQGANTIEKLAKLRNKSINWISEVLQELTTEGFITKQANYSSKGSRKIIEIAGTIHAQKIKEVILYYDTIAFEDILADSKILFLSAISQDWITLHTASQLSKVSIYTIQRHTRALQNRGIIIKKNSLYTINEKAWSGLKEFLIAYRNYITINGVVKWKYQNEVIVQVSTEQNVDGSITGLANYDAFGVQVLTIKALYFLPKREISKEETFIHSLYEVEDPRTLHLALTFFIKNKLSIKKLIPMAMKYGVYSKVKEIEQLLKTKEDIVRMDSLPVFERKDFIRIASIYGVKYVY